MPCSRNDVVLLPIPFTDLSSQKVRPAVVIGNGTRLIRPQSAGVRWESAGDRQFLKPFGVGARREGYEEGTIEGGTGGRGRVLSLRFANC